MKYPLFKIFQFISYSFGIDYEYSNDEGYSTIDTNASRYKHIFLANHEDHSLINFIGEGDDINDSFR